MELRQLGDLTLEWERKDEMYLKKYPVNTETNTYLINVYDSYVALGMYTLKADVYEVMDRKLTFGILKKKKLKKLWDISSGWNNYKEWVGHYVEFASLAVSQYEKSIREKDELEMRKWNGIREFESWDGKVSSD